MSSIILDNMNIALGSTNKTKMYNTLNAVLKICHKFDLYIVDAPSDISEQPTIEEEAIEGAKNRATYALENSPEADYGIGIEGYTRELDIGMFVDGWVVVVDRDGKTGFGSRGGIMLPEDIADRIRSGEELGPVMDDIVGEADVKNNLGAIGYLTGGLVTRGNAFENAVIYAFAPFISKEFYK